MGLMVHLDVAGKRAVVVGGGNAGREKVERLVRAGARVTVVDPDPSAPTVAGVTLVARRFRSADARGAVVVVAATDDPAVNDVVARAGRSAGSVVIRADRPDGGATLAATVERGPVVVGVSTSGASPTLARWLRDRIAEVVTPAVGVLADLLAERPRTAGRRGHRDLPLADALAAVSAGDLTAARALLAEPSDG